MGYRSDVMLCLKKENFLELQKRIRAIESEDKNLMEREEFCKYKEFPEDNAVAFGWESLKWYSEYEAIEIIETYLDELQEADIDYKFIRIGEDYDDIEINDNYINGSCDHIFEYRTVNIE